MKNYSELLKTYEEHCPVASNQGHTSLLRQQPGRQQGQEQGEAKGMAGS